jgi:microcystin-dependent protein
MLSDNRIIAYYSYVVRFWTDYYNSAQTNVEQDFSKHAINELERLQVIEDNEANRLLFETENSAQAAFLELLDKQPAGLATEEELNEALNLFKVAKENRQAIIPNPTALTVSLINSATDFLAKSRKQLDKMQDSNSEQAVITAQRIVADAESFRDKLVLWIQIRNTQERQDEYSGKATETPDSVYNKLGYFQDGNYGKEINRVSPEGFVYGASTFIQNVEHLYWWDGGEWREIPATIDQATSVSLLPDPPQEPNTVFRVINTVNEDGTYNWRYFFWDAEIENWNEILWRDQIEGGRLNLPLTGYFRGEGHKVIEPDVPVFWDGEDWRRNRISALQDDLGIISTVELYGGTLASLTPDIELVYMSPTELALKPVNSDFEYTTVNGTVIDSSKRTSVYSFSPVLDWWDETESFSTSLLQHSTTQTPEEYWVYLANKNDCFNFGSYDFRSRLFCSKTAPNNGRLGKFGTDAYNAILIGRCQTAVPANPSNRVEFLQELDVSLVSRSADLKETFREFSDFDLSYVDENNIKLRRIYGTAGQVFIGGRLYFLGQDITLNVGDARINVDGNGLLSFDYTEIAASAGIDPTVPIYYIYIASDSDIYNDNAINPDTNMPWHIEDEGAGDGVTGPYYANKDLRLKLFLSTKTPEEGRLAETWRGYWARHIGQVKTDSARKFRYSAEISSIRQAVLNPTFFDGLAEVTIEPKTATEFRVIKSAGTSGICMVGGKGVQTYITTSTSPMVHKVTTNDKVYTYTGSPTAPLTWGGTRLNQYRTSFAYLYLTNDNPIWNSLFVEQGRTRSSGTGCLFCATNAPTDAYLSSSYPGSNARWVCTIGCDASGQFSGSFIAENLKQPGGNSAVPSGTILDFGGPTCPNGFLVCNGSWYYPNQYPTLWAAIGGYWGWNGSQFAVPNLNYRCTIGTGNWALGTQNIGEINHTLTSVEVPSHDHSHTHIHNHGGVTGYSTVVYGGYSVGGGPVGVVNNAYVRGGPMGNHSHSISTDATSSSSSPSGGSGSHNNMQPSAVVLKIIRY